jgi:hypothetical protein
VAGDERRWFVRVTVLLVLASLIPYLAAWALAPQGTRFTGLLFNPLDGNSYVAKIRQGFSGSWLFRLPYTSEPQSGAYLFLLHLGLGHVARWSALPLIVCYHMLRIAGGVFMLIGLYSLASLLTENVAERRAAFLLAALGSGLGWLMALLGVETADLWVQEAFPGYSLLANAHFPLTIGLMCWIARAGVPVAGLSHQGAAARRERSLLGLVMVGAAVALGVIQPFGLVPVFGGLGVMLLARGVRERRAPWPAIAWTAGAAIAALPYPLYIQLAIRTDPVLAAWNSQNVTPSPPVWDWMLSYGLVLALAIPGTVAAVRQGRDSGWLLVGWLGVTCVGMYVPFALQRRLSLGLGVSIGLLAGVGWWHVLRERVVGRYRPLVQGVVVASSALTPVFLVLAASLAPVLDGSLFYLTSDEWAALSWLRENASSDTVVLCAPEMGIFVPAWAGPRVVYGHPFETVDAERREQQVMDFYRGEMSAAEQAEFLADARVAFVLVGPREQALGQVVAPGEPVFQADTTSIYQTDG